MDGISDRSWTSFKRELVSNIMRYIYIDCCINGAFLQRYPEKICKNRNSRREKEF